MHLILLDESAPVSNIAIWDRNINALCFGGGLETGEYELLLWVETLSTEATNFCLCA